MTAQKKKKRRPAPDKGGCPLWMMTFGDAMSLLVTFFVMLIAFSSIEEEQLAAVVGALRGALGAISVLDGYGVVEQQTLSDSSVAVLTDEVLHAAHGDEPKASYLSYEELAGIIPILLARIGTEGDDPLIDRLIIEMMSEGLSIVLLTNELFARGSDQMVRDYNALWNGIAELLVGWENEFRVTAVLYSGYPIRITEASTPWGLGVLRAQQIAHRLQAAMNAPPVRFGIGAEVPPPRHGIKPQERVEIIISPPSYLLDMGTPEIWSAEVWR